MRCLMGPSARLLFRRICRARTTKLLPIVFIVVLILDALRVHSKILNVERSKASPTNTNHKHSPGSYKKGERIYIASMHYNDDRLLQDYWGPALLNLIETLGRDSVYVSIYESGSWDNTRGVLQAQVGAVLEERNIPHNIELGEDTHDKVVNEAQAGAPDVIYTTREKWEPRRIPFLSKLRNKTLKDLLRLREEGKTFDKILFLNDVIFSTEDVLTLMDTNEGSYGAACSLDFQHPPKFYDTFALRDIDGMEHADLAWPYFRAGVSRNALVNHMDAVPVKSCWNGIVVMPVDPFVSSHLHFRGIPDSLAEMHLEGSECCLIHADNPLAETLGVYLNPRVRVAYNADAYKKVNPEDGDWISTREVFIGLWWTRIKSWMMSMFYWKPWTIKRRFERWNRESPALSGSEPGIYCLIDEMQVLVPNGWAHV